MLPLFLTVNKQHCLRDDCHDVAIQFTKLELKQFFVCVVFDMKLGSTWLV